MSVDEEPRKKSRLANGRPKTTSHKAKEANLTIPEESKSRSRSPVVPKQEDEEEEEGDEDDEESERKAELQKRQAQPWWIKEKDIQFFTEHRDAVICVGWNPSNNESLATGSADGTARLWDFENNEGQVELAKKPLAINHKSIEFNKKAVSAVTWHPDGTVLGTGMLR